ncbi:TonB-dependent receptor [Pseudoxanthomonas sp. JBR18]|uniref:TonB-dependent receptor n=1 Tax=Pseudoxanthomonas sp. JBR18 TaxID=2969308 RepID=UPI002304E6C9|nr:TonB-dependent receptor [Pseudoxanthomonas sp. JBR18]WCE03007.1 TonB-dependent receptor [Pseudoxanthomonas sp. JBR18]
MSRTLRRATLCVALSMSIASVAHAQSTTGTIFGQVSAEPGTTVLIENTATGQSRTVTVDAAGRYRATALQNGVYKVTLLKDGQAVSTREDVNVQIAGGTEVSFAGDAQDLDRIVVKGTGMSPIDVSSVDTLTVFTAAELSKISVGRSIESVALLAPGVVGADSRYPGTASFGGSAASENAFYINGYAVTNPLTNLGSTTLPFDGISQLQVITGGYGAEFGRATGGVVNIVTQRGTNEFKFGGLATFSPSGLRSDYKNIRYENNGTSSDGLVYQKRDENSRQEFSYAMSASGPIIKDRLFFYVGGEITQQDRVGVLARPGSATSGYQASRYDIPRWLAKLDWNITDNHVLEFTGVSDVTKQRVDYYGFTYAGGQDEFSRSYDKTGGYYYKDGGELYIGKYTGYITDDLTVSALYGKQHQDHEAIPDGYDPSVTYVSDSRGGASPVQFGSYAQLAFPDAYDETDGGRFDIEYRLGNHTLCAGYDLQNLESRSGQVTSGPGYRWIYNTCAPGDTLIPGGGGAACPGGNGDYVSQYKYANGGTFKVKEYAYYLEDRWQISDNWLLSLGVRNENFENYNADSVVYVEQKDQWAPRIGVSWDVNGDSTLKIYANAGRYHLAMPNNVALRGAAGSLFTNEYFSFTGIDPNTGAPLGIAPLGDGPYSSNREYGQAPDPRTVAAQGLKSHYQDEVILGFQQQINEDLTVGARYVYRTLRSAIDDMCDYRPAYAWAIDNGYSEEVAENLGNGLASCRLFNPGEANTFLLDDGSGNFVQVPLTAEELGFPKLKRIYQGVDLFAEHPFDGKWYARVDYTFSRNYGNAEGQLNSDVGQGDVSQTLIWDHPELMEHSNGYLPNDRRHYLKSRGFYQLTPEWRVSATATIRSGRPKSCTGYYPNTPENEEFNSLYAYGGPYYHYCNGEASARGTNGRLPWEYKLDMGLSYIPAAAAERLEFSVDVFNVFNKQVAQNIVEYGENGGVGRPYNSTNRVISYSDPRYVRFAVRWNF